jgi:hypothetical protein
MKILKYVTFFLSFLLLNIYLNGCFIIGFGIGLSEDQPKIDSFNITTKEIIQLEPETPIILYLNNGDILKGKFVKLECISNEDYLKEYNKFLIENNIDLWFPSFNDTVGINSLNNHGYIFNGFDFGCIKLKSILNDLERNTYFDQIIYISSRDGNKLQAKTVIEYMKSGTVPLRSNLVVKNELDIFTIPPHTIIKGEIEPSYSNRIIGLLIGATIDIVLLYSITPERQGPGFIRGRSRGDY